MRLRLAARSILLLCVGDHESLEGLDSTEASSPSAAGCGEVSGDSGELSMASGVDRAVLALAPGVTIGAENAGRCDEE
jgi:hypothetical protein